jgi:transcriptional regulator CtsR
MNDKRSVISNFLKRHTEQSDDFSAINDWDELVQKLQQVPSALEPMIEDRMKVVLEKILPTINDWDELAQKWQQAPSELGPLIKARMK